MVNGKLIGGRAKFAWERVERGTKRAVPNRASATVDARVRKARRLAAVAAKKAAAPPAAPAPAAATAAPATAPAAPPPPPPVMLSVRQRMEALHSVKDLISDVEFRQKQAEIMASF